MTTETTDYSTLEPRALDALVAERVFGCKSGNTDWDFICVCGLGVEGVNQDWPAVHWLGETKQTDEGTVYTHGEGYIPHFSTDPAAAFTVLEAMRAKGWRWSVTAYPEDRTWVELTIRHGHGRESADSMPRAAVIAALRALDAVPGA